MTHLRAEGVTFRYPGASTPALDRIDFAAPAGRITAIVGPSGCGKTTLLRVIAGLEQPDAGHVFFDDRPMNGVPAERRSAVLMFQRPLLLPHLNVAENVSFGLRARGVARPERRQAADDMLDLVDLAGFGSRGPETLSGGQAQRVALARALVVRPKLMLLDEPLTSLDAGLRGEMRALIKSLQRRTGVTTILVTHDLEEALAMADELAVMVRGSIRQSGDPRSLYAQPADVECARILGVENIVPGQKTASGFDTAFGRLPCDPASRPDGPATAIIRAERIRVREGRGERVEGGIVGDVAGDSAGEKASDSADDSVGRTASFDGEVIDRSFRGAETHLRIRLPGAELWVRRSALAGESMDAGTHVRVTVPADAVHLVPPSDAERS